MIKIALFGSEETIKLVKSNESKIEGIQLHSYKYSDVLDIKKLLPTAKDCDVYLFSGILSYSHAKNLVGNFDKPALYIQDNELNVSLTLLTVIHHNLAALDRISVDLPDRKNLDIIIQQLQIDPQPVFIKDFAWIKTEHTKSFEIDSLLQYHIDLYRSQKTDFAITSIHSVYDQLNELGIPCIRMVDAEKTIIDSLQSAKQASILNKTQLSQVAVSIINLKSKKAKCLISDEVTHLILLELRNLAKKVNGEIQKITPEKFEYFGTKGSIQFVIDRPFLLESLIILANQHAVIIHVGSGFGMTMVEAKKNANIALSYTDKELDRNSFIIVTEEKVVMNPIARLKRQTLSSLDERIVNMSKIAKVSVTNLVKMQQLLESRPVNRITSEDVADYFEITRRSAERMLKKYMDVGWLQVIGEEQPYQNGRPRSVYRLDLPE
ncbi:hypothetical protein CSV69_07855 [Sporosarcina sp. P26b]|uniref:hypothetical protein n=1 Tax=Sporosarcina sp. P26b TaxID=2048253 RepID=UPI000C172732|nr:hypothetical protein [Sporosarcina sp. P26b]PIC96038.1 hypothetical protein CSV69_07855 [Sporosarcina sp. P26b]